MQLMVHALLAIYGATVVVVVAVVVAVVVVVVVVAVVAVVAAVAVSYVLVFLLCGCAHRSDGVHTQERGT